MSVDVHFMCQGGLYSFLFSNTTPSTSNILSEWRTTSFFFLSLFLFHEERTFITDLCMACGYLDIVKRDLALIGGKTMKKDEYLISSIRLLAVQTEINPSEFVSELKKLELWSDNLPCLGCKVVLCMLYQYGWVFFLF